MKIVQKLQTFGMGKLFGQQIKDKEQLLFLLRKSTEVQLCDYGWDQIIHTEILVK